MAMFNRFTERARRVILLAKEEAKRQFDAYPERVVTFLGSLRPYNSGRGRLAAAPVCDLNGCVLRQSLAEAN